MLAESRGPDPLGSAQWKPHTDGNDGKLPGSLHRQQVVERQKQTSSQRSYILGLEMASELVWDNWDLGKEFTKTLVLKNVHAKLQKLHFRPPVSKFFTIMKENQHQKIVLSPGTSFSIPVTFRPLKRCEYEDSIEFQSKFGSFKVCLRAIVPCYALELPDSVLLPLCAVKYSSYTTFFLKNASKLHTSFQWEGRAPFQLSPEQGLLKPGEELPITVVFQPQEALVYQEPVYCRFGGEEDKSQSCCSVLLQGLAKYPYLQLKNPNRDAKKELGDLVLDFGSVAVGRTLHKHFDIFNPSPVTASFSLSRLPGGVPLLGSEFSCDVTRGELAPGASVRVAVSFTPAVANTVSVEYLSLNCKGALNETLLKLTGGCIGPKVSLSSPVVDFGRVEEGGAAVKTVDLVNSSPAQAVFQWDLDCCGHSVFCVQPASGTVDPYSCTTLRVSYRPTRPIAHHRRVSCLILHKDPVFLDCIGTCHSELHQPTILKPEHLVLYKLHWSRRDTQLDPCTEESDQRRDNVPVPSTPMEEYFQSCLGNMDPFSSSSSPLPPHVSVSPHELLFHHKLSSSSSSFTSSRSVSITNHTRGKLSLEWTIASDSPFAVSPSSCDLAPLKSTSFIVTYSPKQLNTLHGAQLECFAYNKDNGDLKDRLLCPSWCVTVRVVGHSFQLGKEHFIPRCSLEPHLVVFPSLSVLSHRTVLLQNKGELPLTFSVNLDHDSGPAEAASLVVVPSCGWILPESHQILTLRTIPTEDGPKQGFSLHLELNADKHTQKLTVISTVERPCVCLGGDGSLYFQPTNVGSQTHRSHQIRNLSRLPLRFQWRIPESDQELICVEPDAGELHPNETTAQTWSFSPLEEKTYTSRATLAFWPTQTPECDKSHLTLKVVGTGAIGFIEAKTAVLNVGDVVVGTYRSIEIPLVNNSPCSVSFCVSVQQICLDKDLSYDPTNEPSALHLDCDRLTVASQSTLLLQSTVRPHRRAQYTWTISYQTLNADGSTSSLPKVVCEVRAKGVFPTLQVTDACSGGSIGRVDKMRLWKLLSLDSLNEHLFANPSPTELTYRTPTRHSLRSCPSVFTNTTLDFSFSAAPLNSDPSTFMLMLHNPGSIPVDWAFLFPDDQEIELEYWAETGEFSSTELHQMKIQDNHLFSITPCSGTLHPGQQRAVKFSYSHDFTGTDRLPVVLKLSYGREILLNFQGLTLETDRPYLHFTSKTHVFTSVAIEDRSPPRQMYELYNGGAVPVFYRVDTAVLSQLQADNFNHPVLCCLNPKGEVLPGKTATLEWIFSPVEAKMYHMDIPIQIQDGDSTLVRFEGCGFNSTTLGLSNPLNYSDVSPFVPGGQRLPFPGQMVFLSEDSVSLGDISVYSQTSRILFLTNVSHTDTVHFVWELSQQHSQVVHMSPNRGVLCPRETVSAVLTFTAAEQPTVYQLHLICQVCHTDAALTQYHDALQRLEEERERHQNEFTITDKNLTGSHGVLTEKEPVATPARKVSSFSKYKTLPPICADSGSDTLGNICARLTKAERREKRQSAKVQKDSEPPQPDLLHLRVTAHSHGLTPDQLNEQHRCLQSDEPQRSESFSSSPTLPAGKTPPTHGPERDVLTYVFSSLLRDILDDPAFAQYLITSPFKPVLYQALQTAPPPCKSQKTSSSAAPQCLWHVSEDELREQHSAADGDEAAGRSENETHTPSDRLSAEHTDIVEDVLVQVLQNVMVEASRGELDLTAHPRSVILPPHSARNRRMSRAMAEKPKNKNKPAGT
ncbi:cilia- and flagella-associated protein 65 [Sphaeramia orbicularis]|uniref:cilia- and flagella-associated protein 65 n=1 Tax=Sphaeramia orbicularis TaxID=375764 RepID=UPI00117C3A4D|nr:cilia- and flagella-associated protein 65 [Sphaeramia orbicularis]